MSAGAAPAAGEERLDRAADMGDTMMLGLRLLREGVDIRHFADRYGQTPAQVYGPILDRLAARGLLDISEERIRLSVAGRLLGNRVFAEFLP